MSGHGALWLPSVGAVPRGVGTDSDDQHTPPWLVAMVDDLWRGCIDTDPAWSPACGVKARRTYDGSCPLQDGLSAPWFGNVWCNPPYSDPAPWAARMREHCADRTACEGLLLVNVSTSVRWFHRARPGREPDRCRLVAFFDKRIAFIKDGVERKGNDREQMMLWWGPAHRVRAFRKVFAKAAWIAS